MVGTCCSLQVFPLSIFSVFTRDQCLYVDKIRMSGAKPTDDQLQTALARNGGSIVSPLFFHMTWDEGDSGLASLLFSPTQT